MKFKLLVVTFVGLQIAAYAQNTAIEAMPKISIPENYDTPEFKKRLVDAAIKNNANGKVLKLQTDILKYQVGVSKAQWLNYFSASGNLNEYSINPPLTNNRIEPTFYPRYNFSVNIPFGSLLTNAYSTKIARKNVAVSQLEQQDAEITLRSAVLVQFEEYIQTRELLRLQMQIENDEESSYRLSERKFKANDISIIEFNEAAKSLFEQRSRKIELQRTLSVSKYQLEALTGAQIEDNF